MCLEKKLQVNLVLITSKSVLRFFSKHSDVSVILEKYFAHAVIALIV